MVNISSIEVVCDGGHRSWVAPGQPLVCSCGAACQWSSRVQAPDEAAQKGEASKNRSRSYKSIDPAEAYTLRLP
jgi:hypothetical protein